jgi:hypothetical protein
MKNTLAYFAESSIDKKKKYYNIDPRMRTMTLATTSKKTNTVRIFSPFFDGHGTLAESAQPEIIKTMHFLKKSFCQS